MINGEEGEGVVRSEEGGGWREWYLRGKQKGGARNDVLASSEMGKGVGAQRPPRYS